jgi:ORF6N domain
MKRDAIESAAQAQLAPAEKIERLILLIRGQKVMLDTDLAQLYGVSTKAFNQAIKRNTQRFPPDFMFRLTKREKTEVVTNCDHLKKLRFSPVLPAAFTEHGAIMAAAVLNSERAIKVSVYVVRAFVKLRAMLGTRKDFASNLRTWRGNSQNTIRSSKSCSRPFVSSCSLRPLVPSVASGSPPLRSKP